ncbi:hypothetical protein R6Q59_006435 [Mikania micrantha]
MGMHKGLRITSTDLTESDEDHGEDDVEALGVYETQSRHTNFCTYSLTNALSFLSPEEQSLLGATASHSNPKHIPHIPRKPPILTVDEIVAQQVKNDKRVSETQFKKLATRWFTPKFQSTCEAKRVSHSNMKEPHVSGTKSFARLAHEMSMKNNGVYPTRGEMYIKTQTRKDGTIVDDEASHVAALKDIPNVTTNTSDDQIDITNDAYSKVKGPEKRGYIRLVGSMPTKKDNGPSFAES